MLPLREAADWKMAPTEQPLWVIQRFWPDKGWVVSELQQMEVVEDRLVMIRPKGGMTTYARALAIFMQACKQWPDTTDKSMFRLFNTKTKDFVMGVIL